MLKIFGIREIEIETTMGYYFKVRRINIILKSQKKKTSVGETMEKLGFLHIAKRVLFTLLRNVKWHSHFGKQSRSSSRSYTWSYLVILILGIHLREMKMYSRGSPSS